MQCKTNDWRAIDRTLRGIAQKRAALDAEEAKWLRAANSIRIWREVGCVSMTDYMERYLGYGVRNAQERLKVSLALAELPLIEAALASGAVPFTATRALLRVAKPETEQQWLEHCANMSVHQIEEAVAGRAQGDRPTDPRRPDLELRNLRYDGVRPSTGALEREALAKARALVGRMLTDDEFLAMVFGMFVEGGGAAANANDATLGRAKYQIATIVCESCDQGWRESGGKRFALDAAELERARCDAQLIGPLDTDDPPRATQDVPPRIRLLVRRRDGGRCTVPGCRSTLHLEIHHLRRRADGGTNDPWNLTLVCGSCHDAIHYGLLSVTGRAPDQIVVVRKHSPAAPVPASTSLDRVSIDVDVKSALVQSGFSKGEAAAAVAAARAELHGDLSLETMLREALRRCRRSA